MMKKLKLIISEKKLNFSFLQRITRRRTSKTITLGIILVLICGLGIGSYFIIKSNEKIMIDYYLLENVTTNRYQAAIDYIVSCYDEESGGFRHLPPRYFIDINWTINPPDLWATWTALQTLLLLNEHSNIDSMHSVEWIINEIEDYPDWYGPENLFGVYTILDGLNKTDSISTDIWIEMILDDYKEDGGFRSHKDGPAPVSQTFFAFKLLDNLNALEYINWTKTTDYLLSWQLPSGYFSYVLLPGGENIGETVYAYSFLNASGQLPLVNLTQLEECIQESYTWNLQGGNRISIAYVLLDFTRINGYSFLSYFPDNNELLEKIKTAQNTLYGEFRYGWPDTLYGDIFDTCQALQIFKLSKRLDLLEDNITIIHPPLSPYVETTIIGYSDVYVFSLLLVIPLGKKCFNRNQLRCRSVKNQKN